MGLASFGGHATSGGGGGSSTINVSSKQIGEMMMVPSNFSHSDFLESGAAVDNATYPTLYSSLSTAWAGEGWTNSSLSSVPTAICSAIHGTVIECLSISGTNYIFTSKGYVFTLSANLQTVTYLTRIERCQKFGATVYSVASAFGKIFIGLTSSNLCVIYDSTSFTTYSTPTLPTSASWTFKNANGIMFGYQSGASNVVLKSIDQGVNWANLTLPTTASYVIRGIEYFGGVYLAVTTGTSTNNMATSSDATSWTVRTGPGPGSQGVIATPNYFVIIPNSANSTPYTSTDGINWTSRSVNITGSVTRIWQNTTGSVLMAVYYPAASTAVCHVSTDGGVTWVSRNTNMSATIQAALHLITFVGDNIVSFGCHTTSQTGQINVGYSTDNMTTSMTSTIYGISTNMSKNTMSFSDFTNSGIGVIIETNASDQGYYTMGDFYGWYTTNGGTSWAQTVIPNVSKTPLRIVGMYNTGDGVNIICAGGRVFRSTDGVNWTTISSGMIPTAATPFGTNNNKLFSTTTTTINVSTDYGATFATYNLPVTLAAQHSVRAYGNNLFLTNPSSATVYFSSDDGATWSTVSNAMPVNATGYPGYVAGGARGIFMSCPLGGATSSSSIYLVSTDGGQNWAQRSFPSSVGIQSASYSNGVYYVFIGGSSYMYSTDLMTWTVSSAGADTKLWRRISFDNTGIPYLLGAYDTTYVIRGESSRRLPSFNAPYPGIKWVVKAK